MVEKKLFFETNLHNFFNFISINKILRTIYLVCGKRIITNISEKKIILQIIYHCLSNDSEVQIIRLFDQTRPRWTCMSKMTGHPESTIRNFLSMYNKNPTLEIKIGRPAKITVNI